MLHGDLGERHAALRELRAAADASRDAQRFLEHEPQARAAKAELEAALLAVAYLADDLGLADAGRVEPGRRQKQVLCGALALPGAQAPLGFAVRGRAAGQQLERVAAQVLNRRAVAARENQLDSIAGREIGELGKLHALRKALQLRGSALLLQREFGELFAAALAPRDADQAQLLEQRRIPPNRPGVQPSAALARIVTAVSRRFAGSVKCELFPVALSIQ